MNDEEMSPALRRALDILFEATPIPVETFAALTTAERAYFRSTARTAGLLQNVLNYDVAQESSETVSLVRAQEAQAQIPPMMPVLEQKGGFIWPWKRKRQP